VVEAGDNKQLSSGLAEWHEGVATGELLVALQQGGHPGHGVPSPFKGCVSSLAVAGKYLLDVGFTRDT
jgi:hypothetical protein